MNGTSKASLSASELTFQELAGVFWRRRWMVGSFVGILAIAGWVYSTYISPTEYEKEIQILIAGRTQSSPGYGSDDPLARYSLKETSYDVPTQMTMLTSGEVHRETLSRIDIKPPTLFSEIENYPRIKDVAQLGTSNIVNVTIVAPKKGDAERFAKEMPLVYGRMVTAEKAQIVGAVRKTLESEVKILKDSLTQKQQEYADFQQENEIADATSEAHRRVTEEVRAENSLTVAAATLSGYKARLAQLQSQEASISEYRTQYTKTPNRAQLEVERKRLSQMEEERAQAIITYQVDHPIVQGLDARISTQKDYISTIPENITTEVEIKNPEFDLHQVEIRRARADVEEAQARVDRLQIDVAARRNDVDDLAPVRAETLLLDEEIKELQQTLSLKRAALSDLDIRSSQILNPIKSLDLGREAEQTQPRTIINVVLGLFIGLVIGCFAALGRDLALDEVNYPADAVEISGADILARIPLRSNRQEPLIRDPEKARAFESYRILRSSLLLKLQSLKDNALVVTSTEQGEGKSVVASNLAAAFARDGRKTLLVDANLRHPQVAALLNVKSDNGLSNVLNGDISLDAAVQDTEIKDLQVLSAGDAEVSPTESLSTPEMKSLVQRMKADWDVVIFDSAGSWSVADTLELARTVHNTVFVVEHRRTNKTRMQQALSFLENAESRLLGVVMNKDRGAKTRIS